MNNDMTIFLFRLLEKFNLFFFRISIIHLQWAQCLALKTTAITEIILRLIDNHRNKLWLIRR